MYLGAHLLLATAIFGKYASADDTSGTSVQKLGRKDVPLMFDNEGRYYLSLSLDSQRLNFSLSTGTGVIFVSGLYCSSCGNATGYDISSSATAIPMNVTPIFTDFLGVSADAPFVKETCSFDPTDGSLWSLTNETLSMIYSINATDTTTISLGGIGDSISGLVGLGTNRGFIPSVPRTYLPTFDDSIYGQFLSLHPDANSFTFGIALNPPKRTTTGTLAPSQTDTNAGIINWLQLDPSRYDASSLVQVTVNNSVPMIPATYTKDWIFQLDAWKIFSGGNAPITSDTSMAANVDLFYQGIYFPLIEATRINNAIAGSVLESQRSTLGAVAQSWSIPCNSDFHFEITLGSQTIQLDSKYMIMNNSDGTCTSGIEGWVNGTVNQHLFGARFMSAMYMIFNVNRDGTSDIGFASKTSDVLSTRGAHPNLGAIIGGTVGGIVVVLAILTVSFFFFKKRREARPQRTDESDLFMVSPSSSPTITTFSNIPNPDSPSPEQMESIHGVLPTLALSPELGDYQRQLISSQRSEYSIATSRAASPLNVPENPSYFRVVARNNPREAVSHFPGALNSYMSTSSDSRTSFTHPQSLAPLRASAASTSDDYNPPWLYPQPDRMDEHSKGKEVIRESVAPPAYSPGGLRNGLVVMNSGEDGHGTTISWLPEKAYPPQ